MAIIAMGIAVQGYAQPRFHHPRPMPIHYLWYPTYGYYYYPALGCYWWGSTWDAPTKIQVECLKLKRTDSGRLRIKNGDLKKQYLSLWLENSIRFRCPSGVVVDVVTGDGIAKITVYSKDGQTTAKYTL